jgi:hypothetical protein
VYLHIGNKFVDSNIKKIIFEKAYNCSFSQFELPSKIEHVVISGKKGNENIINHLPETMEYLEIIDTIEFQICNLPTSLKHIFFNIFNKKIIIDQSNLPFGLQTLKIFKSYSKMCFRKIPFGCELIVLEDDYDL